MYQCSKSSDNRKVAHGGVGGVQYFRVSRSTNENEYEIQIENTSHSQNRPNLDSMYSVCPATVPCNAMCLEAVRGPNFKLLFFSPIENAHSYSNAHTQAHTCMLYLQ